jgi:DNA-binding winged helix-turn-helix (wHTH) protein/tetratricopeptide (TPR) repeat protein
VKAGVYRFGECEVSITRREVLLQGEKRVLEPRPFDLLAYLIEQRHRVVTKNELLERLWQQEFVSGSVIARAVMKARHAIGDNGKEPALIRTVHRKGYRFVGELEHTLNDDAAPVGPLAPLQLPAGTVSLALLPFDNRTGQAELDWIELGLMSLSAKALSADPRLAVASIPSLLTALGSLGPQASLEERVRVVQRLLGVRHVVHVAISHDGEQFSLDYGIDLAPRDGARSLLALEVTQLGRQLAREVAAALFPADTAAAAIAFDSTDPLATESLARAMQAVGEQKWKLAVNLLEVVLDIDPDNIGVQLEHARALAHLGDDKALRISEQLLSHAQAMGDAHLTAMTHQAMAFAFNNKNLYEPANHHLGEALRQAEAYGPQDWVVQSLIQRAGIAVMQRDFARARGDLDRVRGFHQQGGNKVYGLYSSLYSALVHTKCGNLFQSLEIGRKVLGLSVEYRLNSLFVVASLNLAHACAEAGLWAAAIKHAEKAFDAAQSLSALRYTLAAGDSLCWFYRELRATRESARVVASVQAFEEGLAPSLQPHLMMARGHDMASQGDHAQAATFMRMTVDSYKASHCWLVTHEMLPWLATSLIQSSDPSSAAAVFAEAHELPTCAADPELRGGLLHCQAQQAHLQGDREAALARLIDAADTAPMGLWRAHACMDAAWLHLEAGNVSAAQRLLRDLGSWLNEHPAGMTVDARFKFATGQFAAAHEAQQRYARAIQCEMPAYHAELAAIYAAAALNAPSSVPALPLAGLLPTKM